jgi:hypothetical protein
MGTTKPAVFLGQSIIGRYAFSCSVEANSAAGKSDAAHSDFDVVRTVPRCDLPTPENDFASLHRAYPTLTAEQARNPEAAFHGRIVQRGSGPQRRRLNVWFVGGLIQYPEVHYESNYFMELLKHGFPNHEARCNTACVAT